MRVLHRLISGALVIGAILVPATSAQASAIVLGQFNSNSLAGNDDGSVSGPVALGFNIDFFGLQQNNVFVNNNGNVTFTGTLGTFTPFNLITTGVAMIAPFFADVDTRAGNLMTYGQGTFDGHAAFGVNWIDVGYFSVHTNLLNSFQLIMVSRPDTGNAGNFDFMFNYDKILWETGDASGGSGGCGGGVARAGYSNGSTTSFELTGSGIAGAFVDEPSPCNGPAGANQLTTHSLNSDIAGRYLFAVRNGVVVVPGDTNPVPEPTTVVMFGTGLAMLVGVARRRRQR